MVLDHPLMDLNMLPIIGDEELETPIYIPNRTMNATLTANQSKLSDKKINVNFMHPISSYKFICRRATKIQKRVICVRAPTEMQILHQL
jgi:hypothetical protein